jgi:hypothetical protein
VDRTTRRRLRIPGQVVNTSGLSALPPRLPSIARGLPMPVNMRAVATHPPPPIIGTLSPYPTVVTVTTARQIASPKL